MSYIEEHRRGLFGTILFHLIILLVLIWFAFDPVPPTFPDPDGIVIDFGNTETGMGRTEPSPAATPRPVQPQVTPPPVVTPPQPTEPTPVVQSVVTQDFDDAPTMQQIAERKKKEEEQKKKIEEQRKQREIENQLKAEEQKRLAEEQKRLEEERKKREAEQKRIDEINKRTQNLFGGGSGTGQQSQGEAGGPGNQGKPDGQIGVNNYTGGGSGNGIDWSLNGRSAITLPQPARGIQSSGKVVVEIIVNQNGEVISAQPGVKGSTTMDGRLLEAAQKAAQKTKFNVSPNSPDRQRGTMTYIFELQ